MAGDDRRVPDLLAHQRAGERGDVGDAALGRIGLVNAFVRPVVTILTLPVTILTLGLFLLVVNAAMIGLVGLLLPGFHVDGFWPAVFAAIVTGVVSWVGQALIREG